MHKPDAPRSLRDPAAIAARRQLLEAPRMAPLVAYVARLRAMGRGEVPDFDPLDGGAAAQGLFLFEKPGPMTDATREGARAGSGFISRDNDDPTAKATFSFMQEAGFDRRQTVIWNVVPWWNGTRRITGEELRAGVARVEELLGLLPDLRAVILVGRKAARAKPLLHLRSVEVIESAHPSPLVRASNPDKWNTIPQRWAQVAGLLRGRG